jgi:hypothetical protein
VAALVALVISSSFQPEVAIMPLFPPPVERAEVLAYASMREEERQYTGVRSYGCGAMSRSGEKEVGVKLGRCHICSERGWIVDYGGSIQCYESVSRTWR